MGMLYCTQFFFSSLSLVVFLGGSLQGTPIYSARRKIDWKRVRGFKPVLALTVATAAGAGLFPIAPGTMGSLAAMPLAYFTHDWDGLSRVLLWFGLVVVGTWSARVFDETMGTSDNQNIVIDEVVGLGISSWTAGAQPKTWIAAFLLFRFFDVLKPPPVRQVDEWSKKSNSPLLRGFGVIADDIVAGFQALAIILLLQVCGILP